MPKQLSKMSLEELWELFPIVLQEHQEVWKRWYEEEHKRLKQLLLTDEMKRISHIGSTAIDTIWAKPIIDILIELSSGYDFEKIKNVLLCNRYRCMSDGQTRISFNKGYTKQGFAEQVYHLHLRIVGDHDELYFRDYLTEHRDIAKEYEALKLQLWKRYEYNRDAYTENKTEFIKRYTKKAKEEFYCRYE